MRLREIITSDVLIVGAGMAGLVGKQCDAFLQFDARDDNAHGQIWTPVVLTDQLVVELVGLLVKHASPSVLQQQKNWFCVDWETPIAASDAAQ